MPRDGSGTYVKPFPDVISDTTIESAVHNGEIADIELDLNRPRPISSGGTGATNARDAMIALGGEFAKQVISNYDSDVLLNGSFYSAAGATSAPNATNRFAGIYYGNADDTYATVEARDLTTGVLYFRKKVAGVWDALWKQDVGTITSAPGTPASIAIDAPSGQASQIVGLNAGVMRWLIQMGNGGAESGTATGNDFYIHRYNNDGSYGGNPLGINRATGLTTINTLNVNGTLSANSNAGVSGTLAVNGAVNFASTLTVAGAVYTPTLHATSALWTYSWSGNPTLGMLFFGNSGNAYLYWNGGNYAFTGGPVDAPGFSTGGSVTASGYVTATGDVRGANVIAGNGQLYARNNGNPSVLLQDANATGRSTIFYNRANNSLDMFGPATTSISLPANGKMQASNGIQSKAGFSGGYGTVCYNLNWDGAAGKFHLYADDIHLGVVPLMADITVLETKLNTALARIAELERRLVLS
jgi:hypothetical protein